MALIPSDVGIRMRMQTEANLLQPVTPAHEIPSDLPELLPGQTFTARVQEALPDNTYRALVAGKQLTLQLPEGSKAGDTLDLVVIDRTGKVIIAKPIETSADAGGEVSAYPFAKFSPAARLISQLLPSAGEAPQPAQLNRGQPLLAAPPLAQNSAQTLAPTLARAIAQSGLFYEAHQAQWVTGQRPLADLLLEPQGQRSLPSAFQHAAGEAAARPHAMTLGNPPQPASGTAPAAEIPTAKVDAGGTPANPSLASAAGIGAQQVGEEFKPLVQQQLEASSTQRMLWHGEVWPRQNIEWEIDWQNERAADGGADEFMRWGTTLSLTTPRLGRVDARLNLSASGVQITLATPYGASAADMRDEAPKLAAALEAAGVPLLSLHIKHEDESVATSAPHTAANLP
jgi:hypothetical protein